MNELEVQTNGNRQRITNTSQSAANEDKNNGMMQLESRKQ
jgi:hypothetical protein